jgi:hypothetical protein
MICPRTLIACFILLGILAASPASADDPLLSRVGRVAIVDGTVAVRPAGGEWADSGVNDPVASAMSVRTPAQGRAALRIGAETIALAGSSELDLARLDPDATQIVLRQGRIGVRLAARTAGPLVHGAGVPEVDPARSFEIDIARGGVWLLTPGDYDITAGDERTPARIAVLDGRARFVGKGAGTASDTTIDTASDTALDTTIATGSATVLSGNDPVVATPDGAAGDDFVAWWRPPDAAGADTAAADRQAPHTLSTDITGYEALDRNGSWQTAPGYGAVWFPATAPGDWAPYRYGHWRWIAPWGWTWIDDMAWGFAPSHYGRWASIPQVDPLDPSDLGTVRWGWVPGAQVADPGRAPVYAPALVAFLGTAGVGLSYPDAVGPAVAWFPLAPGDIYWPGYTRDLDLIRRINQGTVADPSTIGPGINGEPPAEIVNGDYPNRRFASVVPRSVFLAGRPVAPALLRLPGQRLANAPLLPGSPQIAPAAQQASVVAPASGAATRLVARAAPGLARAMHTIAGILQRRARTAAARPVFIRSAQARAATLALSRHSPGWNAPPARPRVNAAASAATSGAAGASRTARPRLRLAAIHRTMAR